MTLTFLTYPFEVNIKAVCLVETTLNVFFKFCSDPPEQKALKYAQIIPRL